MIEINLSQAKKLLEMFGESESVITVKELDDGSFGAGLYAWHSEYPEEGSFYLPELDEIKTKEEYEVYLKEASGLIDKDPVRDSADGRRLLYLTAIIGDYEYATAPDIDYDAIESALLKPSENDK